MNNKPNYKKGTRREIIKMMHTCGIIPVRSVALFDTPRTYRDKMREMEREGTLAEYKVKNGRKTYRYYALNEFEKRRKEYGDSLPDGYYETYVTYCSTLANVCRNKPGAKSLRIIAAAEAYVMMRAAGAACDPDTKMTLFGKEPIDGYCNYYESREIKSYTGYKSKVNYETDVITNEAIKKVVSSRITGLLVSPGGAYSVYNLVDGMHAWQRGGELRMKAHINKLLGDKMMNPEEAETCVLISREYSTFSPLLSLDFNKKTDLKINSSYENLKSAYSEILVIPYSMDGRKMVEMMQVSDWRGMVRRACLYGYETKDLRFKEITCDGYNDSEYVIIFCVPDIERLKRFKAYAEADGNKNRYMVVCFDFQLGLVAKTCRSSCRISTVPFEQIYKMIANKA